jgi:hypothetical protein
MPVSGKTQLAAARPGEKQLTCGTGTIEAEAGAS